MRRSLPSGHSDRHPRDRATQGKGRRTRPRDGASRTCATRYRRNAWPSRSRCPCSAGAGTGCIQEPAAYSAPSGPRQNCPAQDFTDAQDCRHGGRATYSQSGAPMKFAYYPGCSARSTCAELNVATHRVAHKLGLELLQLESATCTGARELRAIDPAGFYTLNVRILALAEREGLPLMTICNTCTLNVLDAHAAFVDDSDLATRINARLADEGLRYGGHTRISHFLWVLYEDIGEARLRTLGKRPLNGLAGW